MWIDNLKMFFLTLRFCDSLAGIDHTILCHVGKGNGEQNVMKLPIILGTVFSQMHLLGFCSFLPGFWSSHKAILACISLLIRCLHEITGAWGLLVQHLAL